VIGNASANRTYRRWSQPLPEWAATKDRAYNIHIGINIGIRPGLRAIVKSTSFEFIRVFAVAVGGMLISV